ncbi:hypothetical protein [Pseudomonas bohemica]|uniref:hypothetical protein n=1 Tax=Pseudomonas bohemica TaxID=2044872 RepID=UPI000DA60178|nr:hypothetical protein [Pseudomonas bohemica]
MDALQNKRFENLMAQALSPDFDLIARELIARARGWIDGLLEGKVITTERYSELFRVIYQVEAQVYARTHGCSSIAS